MSELLEVLAVGLATTGVATVLLALPPRGVRFVVDVDAWSTQGTDYLRQHVRLAVSSVVVVLLVATLIAYGLYLVERLRTPAEFRAQGGVWVHALGARPTGTAPWIGVRLNDGRLVEGLLHSFSLAEGASEDRDVALQRPIRVTNPGREAEDLDLDRLIVSGREIAHIAVIHVPERT